MHDLFCSFHQTHTRYFDLLISSGLFLVKKFAHFDLTERLVLRQKYFLHYYVATCQFISQLHKSLTNICSKISPSKTLFQFIN